jgi:hypothetical protein
MDDHRKRGDKAMRKQREGNRLQSKEKGPEETNPADTLILDL